MKGCKLRKGLKSKDTLMEVLNRVIDYVQLFEMRQSRNIIAHFNDLVVLDI